jgi:hypothetical protein
MKHLNERRKVALKHLEDQLSSGVKTIMEFDGSSTAGTKNRRQIEVPLTELDISRINKEIIILNKRIIKTN